MECFCQLQHNLFGSCRTIVKILKEISLLYFHADKCLKGRFLSQVVKPTTDDTSNAAGSQRCTQVSPQWQLASASAQAQQQQQLPALACTGTFWWRYYMSLTNKPPICSRLNQSRESSPKKNLTATYSVGCMEKSVPLLPKWLPLPANCLINWSLLVSTIFTPAVSLMLA